MIIRRRLRVSGRVQGVGYRYGCRDEARARRLTGWVTNCDDGSVEAVFEGPAEAVESMISWCRRGPASARVTQVSLSDEQPTGEAGFHIV